MSASTTASYSDGPTQQTSLGFALSGQSVLDVMCMGDFCFESQFINVDTLLDSWFTGYNMSNIGGVIGLGYNLTDQQGSSIWTNSLVSQNLEFAIQLRPSLTDWSWNPDAPDMTGAHTSYLQMGGPNFSIIRDVEVDEFVDEINVLESIQIDIWQLSIETFTFSSVNDKQIKAYNTLKSYPAVLSVGFSGLGLPSDMFSVVVGIMK